MPKFTDQERLAKAIANCGGQGGFAERATRETGFPFVQGQVSIYLNRPTNIRDPDRYAALTKFIQGILDGSIQLDNKLLRKAKEAKGSRGMASSISEQSIRRRDDVAKVEFWEAYRPQYERDFGRARDLWMSGLNLRRIIHGRMKDVRAALKRGGRIRIIFIDPEPEELRRYAAMQDWGTKDAIATEKYRDTVWEAYRLFYGLVARGKRKARGLKKTVRKIGSLKIRRLSYPLPYGIDAMTFEDDPKDGAIYVRYYPVYSGVDDRPIVPLRPSDGYWYTYYKEQFDIQWRAAKPWKSGLKPPSLKSPAPRRTAKAESMSSP